MNVVNVGMRVLSTNFFVFSKFYEAFHSNTLHVHMHPAQACLLCQR